MSVRENINEGKYRVPTGSMLDGEAYRTLQGHLEQEVFRADALAEVGLTGHPREDLLWDYAWDLAHSAGLGDVLIELHTLADLIGPWKGLYENRETLPEDLAELVGFLGRLDASKRAITIALLVAIVRVQVS